MVTVSAYDDEFDRARAVRESADEAALAVVKAIKAPTGAAAIRFWSELRRLADEQVWPSVEQVRTSADPPSWAELGWMMETTGASMRNAYSRYRKTSEGTQDLAS